MKVKTPSCGHVNRAQGRFRNRRVRCFQDSCREGARLRSLSEPFAIRLGKRPRRGSQAAKPGLESSKPRNRTPTAKRFARELCERLRTMTLSLRRIGKTHLVEGIDVIVGWRGVYMRHSPSVLQRLQKS